jgi:hypothetical protein
MITRNPSDTHQYCFEDEKNLYGLLEEADQLRWPVTLPWPGRIYTITFDSGYSFNCLMLRVLQSKKGIFLGDFNNLFIEFLFEEKQRELQWAVMGHGSRNISFYFELEELRAKNGP